LAEDNNFNAIYLNLSKEFEGGFCNMRFIEHSLKKTDALPLGSKNLCITEKGFYNITFSEHLKNNSCKLISSVALSKNQNSSYWQHERRLGPPTVGVNPTGHVALACAGFACDEQRTFCGGCAIKCLACRASQQWRAAQGGWGERIEGDVRKRLSSTDHC
jgi:hypothetical protein